MANLKSIYLDGNDVFSAVDHADFKPTGNFTMGAWIKVPSNTTGRYIFMSAGSQAPNYDGIGFFVTSGHKIDFDIARNTGTVDGTDYKSLVGNVTVDDNAWHWVVCVYDGTKMYIYVDGSLDNSVAWTNAPGFKATNYVRLGATTTDGSSYTQYLTGNVDEFFMINGTAWNSTNVTSYYQTYITGATNLKAYYQFEDNLNDSSDSHTLTAVGTTTYQADVPFDPVVSATNNGYFYFM
jgi:hypothetical protein